MTRKLILIKHAAPIINEDVPAREWILSEDGKRKSELLGDLLANYKTNTIYCSHEPKAKETAEGLAQALGLKVVQKDNIHEHERQNVKFLPRGEFVETMMKFFQYANALILGHETANEAKNRYIKAIKGIINDAPEDEDVIIVAHGTVNTLFVSEYNTINQFEFWCNLDMPSYVVLDIPTFELLEVVENI